MPSNLLGEGIGDLAIFGGLKGEKSLEKIVSKYVWGYFGGGGGIYDDSRWF